MGFYFLYTFVRLTVMLMFVLPVVCVFLAILVLCTAGVIGSRMLDRPESEQWWRAVRMGVYARMIRFARASDRWA